MSRPSPMTAVQALQKAAQLHGDGDLAQAERLYRAVAAAAPDTPDVYNLMGALCSQTGRIAPAIALAQRAVALAPDNAAFHFNNANAKRQSGDPAGAARGYRRALLLNPGYDRAWGPFAETLRAAGADAAALAVRPDDDDALLRMAHKLVNRPPWPSGAKAAATAAARADRLKTGQRRRWRALPIAPVAPSPRMRLLAPQKEVSVTSHETPPRHYRYDVPPLFVALLENALILPTNLSAATSDGALLLRGMAPYSRVSVGLLDGFGPWNDGAPLLTADPPDPLRYEEEAILLGGDGNFAHGVLDWLSRLMTLELAQAAQPELAALPLLVSDRAPRAVTALLRRLGFGDRLRSFSAARGLSAARLWAPSLTHEFQAMNPDWADWLRDRLGVKNAPLPSDGERLFLARRQWGRRRLLNEDAVLSVLSEAGFTPFYAEDWTLDEQVTRLSAARALVGVQGAGMAAVMFAPPGCRVVELTHDQMVLPQYAILCALLRQPYRQIVGRAEPHSGDGGLTFDVDFSIDPAELRREISNFARTPPADCDRLPQVNA